MTAGKEKNANLEDLQELLHSSLNSDKVDESIQNILVCFESSLTQYLELIISSNMMEETQLIASDMIKLPDRMANMAAAFKVDVPDKLLPKHYCDNLLLCLGHAIKNSGVQLNPKILGHFVSKLLSNFRSDCSKPLNKFLRFLAALLYETNTLCPKISSAFHSMDNKPLEACLLSALTCLQPNQMYLIFGEAFKEPGKFKIVENLIFLRGTLTEEEMCCLLAYLSLLKADHVMRILRRAFLLVADKVFIEFSKYRDQVAICKCVCICLALLSDHDLKQAKMHFTPILMKGAMYWMDLTPEKRTLGMCLLLTTLKKFGEDNLPEWNIEDQQLLNNMEKLTNYSLSQKIQNEISVKILSSWQTLNNNIKNDTPVKSKQTPPQNKELSVSDVNGPTLNGATNDTSDDLLDSDDDEFPAYDMSNDTKVHSNKKKKILYLREVIEELGNPESDYIEDCFGLLPDLCRRHLKHEDVELVPLLTKGILYSQNRFDTKDWILLREKAAVSILETRPVAAAKALVPAFYDRNFPMDTRFGILSWLVKAAEPIQNMYSGKPEFSDYIKTCVRGLCGGAGWAKLEFTGLESHYVSQLLIAIGTLLKTGKNLPFWPELACDYLDLVLYTARSGRSVIQTTCVHSINLVLSLTEAHMVQSMEDVLARVSQWLGQAQGEHLGEEGANALMMMVMLQQEYNKLVMEQQLNPSTTITFKTPACTERTK